MFWLLTYDLFMFGAFYILYWLSSLNDWEIVTFSYYITYIVTIAFVVIANSISLILMIFVLYHIYSSIKLVKQLDQKQMLLERKRIAWVIVFQSIISFFLCASRIIAFYNVSQMFGDKPTMGCYGPFLNFYDSNGWAFQEIFCCIDGLLYIFFLTPYREQLFKIFRKLLRRDKVHTIVVSVSNNHNSNKAPNVR